MWIIRRVHVFRGSSSLPVSLPRRFVVRSKHDRVIRLRLSSILGFPPGRVGVPPFLPSPLSVFLLSPKQTSGQSLNKNKLVKKPPSYESLLGCHHLHRHNLLFWGCILSLPNDIYFVTFIWCYLPDSFHFI